MFYLGSIKGVFHDVLVIIKQMNKHRFQCAGHLFQLQWIALYIERDRAFCPLENQRNSISAVAYNMWQRKSNPLGPTVIKHSRHRTKV